MFFLHLFISEKERVREREHAHHGGGAERKGDTESEAGSRLQAISTEPNARLELTNCKIMNQAEVRGLTDGATQVPRDLTL